MLNAISNSAIEHSRSFRLLAQREAVTDDDDDDDLKDEGNLRNKTGSKWEKAAGGGEVDNLLGGYQ